MHSQLCSQQQINISSGLVPDDTKTVPEPMLTKIISYGITRPQWFHGAQKLTMNKLGMCLEIMWPSKGLNSCDYYRIYDS